MLLFLKAKAGHQNPSVTGCTLKHISWQTPACTCTTTCGAHLVHGALAGTLTYPLISFNTLMLYFAQWSSSFFKKKKRKKPKAQLLGPWSSSKVISILTVISNRSKAKPESSDYPLQNPSIGISKRKEKIKLVGSDGLSFLYLCLLTLST